MEAVVGWCLGNEETLGAMTGALGVCTEYGVYAGIWYEVWDFGQGLGWEGLGVKGSII